MDRRDRDLKWYTTFDEKRMVATIEGAWETLNPLSTEQAVKRISALGEILTEGPKSLYNEMAVSLSDIGWALRLKFIRRLDNGCCELTEKGIGALASLADPPVDEPEEIEFPVVFEVCGTCDGKGSHVNPSIDSHGLTAADFDEDPDFREGYFEGRYDVQCNECGGRRVVPVIDEARATAEQVEYVQKHIEDKYQYEAECEAERRMGA